MWSYSRSGEEIATGGMALWYCRPLKSLRILGGEKSVLSADLCAPLAAARRLIYDRKYAECLAALERFTPANTPERTQAERLRTIATRMQESIAQTLASIRANIAQGDLFLAERQLHALEPIVIDTDRIEGLARMLNTDESKAIIEAGKKYYDAMKWEGSRDLEFFRRAPAIVFDSNARDEMKKIATSAESGRYAAMAADALKRWKEEAPAPKPVTLATHSVELASDTLLYLGREDGAKRGVHYRYCEFDSTPETTQAVRNMKPVKEGTAPGFDLSVRNRDENFGIVFRTFVEIAAEDDYTFTITSDDGSVLYVDGDELIDNGGLHGMVPKNGTVRLSKGRHELECVMFQGRHGSGLRVEMASRSPRGSAAAKTAPFQVDDPTRVTGLRLRVNATDAVTVDLNARVICRFHKKRRKHLFDESWNEWEEVTLRPEAVTLLRAGENTLGVTTSATQLGPTTEKVRVELQALREERR
jgi:hypothetical protein